MLGVMRATAGGFLVGICTGGAIVLGLLAGQTRPGLGVADSTPMPSAHASPATTPQPMNEPQVADTFLVLRRETTTKSSKDAWDELLVVRGGMAKPIPFPKEVDHSVAPMSDGERVYAYLLGNGQRGIGKSGRRLAAFTLDGREDETISDSTPLVEPRGLFASPNGTILAFFLDNRETLATELWTYDTAARSKRVAVERLVRGAFTGPVFAPDGTLLLRAGAQLFRAPKHRARADILPLVLEDHVQWDAGVVLSPDGSRIALVVQTREGNEVKSQLRIYPLGVATPTPLLSELRGAGPTTRFSSAGPLKILTWLGPEEILVRQSDEILLLRGEVPQITRLEADAASARVGGDQRSLASLVQVGGQTEIVTVDLSQGARHAVLLPPLLSSSGPPTRPSETPTPRYELVQYLRVARAPGAILRGAMRHDAVLRLVSEQIRTITEAPPGETASAERVWFTTTPGAVYVDYRIGTTLWRRLVQVPASLKTEPVATVRGVFAPVDGSWALARGSDLADSAPVTLYEFEPEVGQWIEKPLVQGAQP